MFQATARLKELSIRKVLGASVQSLVSLLSTGNFKTIAISSVCCFPIIYYFSSAWLNNYPLRISLNVWYFLVPVAVVTLIVAITSGFQILKAALTNPVNHLKHE
jgi:putative ABC transport system permease protein